MNSEADQQDKAASAGAPSVSAKAAKRQPGVPVWRTGKPDAFLAAAVDVARAALEGITAPGDIGQHLAAKSEGDRLVTHLFECRLPGYLGWQWFAVLTRNSRSKVVTVSELGLLPSEGSILAPDWVPWAERVRPEDEQQEAEGHDAGADTSPPEPAADQIADDQPAGGEFAAGEPANDEPANDEPKKAPELSNGDVGFLS